MSCVLADEDHPGTRGPFIDGKLRVQKTMCPTCIFRPGNLMDLKPGRVQEMVRSARAAWSVISCHDTLDGDRATCNGYADLRPTPDPIQFAARLGMIVVVESDGE